MHNIEVGKLLTNSDGQRDAIHVAVIPVTAAYGLLPGERISVRDGRAISDTEDSVGIVDPFLRKNVLPGETFYMFMLPNTVTSLRHDWEHHAFDSRAAERVNSQAVTLARICSDYGMRYNDVLRTSPDDWCKNTDDDLPAEFWRLYAAVTGKLVDTDDRYVRCAC